MKKLFGLLIIPVAVATIGSVAVMGSKTNAEPVKAAATSQQVDASEPGDTPDAQDPNPSAPDTETND